MGILVFLIVIVALIVVHEFGHFVVAKLSGMRVDEFGLGFPPRAAVLAKRGETEYTLNWLPLGGFVKIYGEDGTETGPRDPRAFGARPRVLQAAVLVAGVAMNLIFAYVLITGALIAGTPRALTPEEATRAHDVTLGVAGVLPGSPAAKGGLVPGDIVVAAEDGHYVFEGTTAEAFTEFVTRSGGNATITLTVRHGDGEQELLFLRPEQGIVPGDSSRYALGVEVGVVGVVPLSPGDALVEGARLTWSTTVLTAVGLWHFFYGIATGQADFSQVAGPVGIAGVVGGASENGFGDLLSIMAIISINLALINLIPIPALDGGRLLFVLIEGVLRRPINPVVTRAMNATSFALLILLMLVVTAHDIFRIVG